MSCLKEESVICEASSISAQCKFNDLKRSGSSNAENKISEPFENFIIFSSLLYV